MNWIRTLFTDPDSPATACLVFGLVIALGFVLGAVRIRGVKLGVAGVLFVGIAFGHFGFRLNHSVLEFAREFGLVLFVYTLGLAVGPGFLNALRAEGLKLNLCAVAVVLLGAGLCLLLAKLLHISIPVAVGLYCGATTNTPSLAAATAALSAGRQKCSATSHASPAAPSTHRHTRCMSPIDDADHHSWSGHATDSSGSRTHPCPRARHAWQW